jgi:hypothetical protein
VLDAAARRHASNVRVFGSVVRGDDTPTSDIDLLVDVRPQATPLDPVGLSIELEELLGVPVDVGPAAAPRTAIREAVLAEAVTL